MSAIKDLYDFVSIKGLELHTYVYDGKHRIVILWPNGCNHNGSVMNMEVCEAEAEDPGKASEEAFEKAVRRYAEILRTRTLHARREKATEKRG